MNGAPLAPIAALLQVLPWAALTCAVLWGTVAKRKRKPLGLRWLLLLLLLWVTATAVFLVLQDAFDASGRNENLFILAGVLAGYALANFCVRVFWERGSDS
jgi:hypothetical protein